MVKKRSAKKKAIAKAPKNNNKEERGILLTIWLVIMFVANFISGLFYFLFIAALEVAFPGVPFWVFWIYGAIAFANFAFAVNIWHWKRWAFYAFCVSAAVVFVMNLAMGLTLLASISGLAAPVILYILLIPKWKLLE